MAIAKASAASACGLSESFKIRVTISCTCTLSAEPIPTTVCLTKRAAYSNTGKSWFTAATIAVPRACPSFKAESAFLAINTCSMTNISG